ncbi:hypothetical protein GBF38_001661 [Nibea albiflora]|uniref:Uncharacterized protein n=1 Tax=Nibea albiflora TaxID=240163 RepID=A0ACB7EVE9_NIBAL|nr:hypothetical protein GBF38_001661 [Nibea albiflora]
MEKEKGSGDSRDLVLEGFVLPSHELEGIKQRSHGKHIMSAAYHPFSPPQKQQTLAEPPEDGKMHKNKELTLQDQRHYSALSPFSLPHTVLFWKPGESADGAMDYPGWMACRV